MFHHKNSYTKSIQYRSSQQILSTSMKVQTVDLCVGHMATIAS